MSIPSTPESSYSTAGTPTCYRHPDRTTYVTCNRCGRHICGDCMRSAAVGHQCVDCVRGAAKAVPAPRTRFGGRERGSTVPIVTYVLIGLNVAVYALQLASGGELERQLALWAPAVADGEYYRLVTSAFLHYGAMHIIFNMWALFVVGPPLERWLGRLRFSSLYALSALGGSVLVYWLSSLGSATAGASGAVFGLFGATFVVARKLDLDVRFVVALIGINLAFTFIGPQVGTGAISWQGHVGGLITGAAIAAAYVYAPRERRNLVQGGATAAVVVAFAVLIVWRTLALQAQFPYLVIVG